MVESWEKGGPADSALAVKVLHRACNEKQVEACGTLGSIFFNGMGVLKDPAEGRAYMARACKGGHKQACDVLKKMDPK